MVFGTHKTSWQSPYERSTPGTTALETTSNHNALLERTCTFNYTIPYYKK